MYAVKLIKPMLKKPVLLQKMIIIFTYLIFARHEFKDESKQGANTGKGSIQWP